MIRPCCRHGVTTCRRARPFDGCARRFSSPASGHDGSGRRDRRSGPLTTSLASWPFPLRVRARAPLRRHRWTPTRWRRLLPNSARAACCRAMPTSLPTSAWERSHLFGGWGRLSRGRRRARHRACSMTRRLRRRPDPRPGRNAARLRECLSTRGHELLPCGTSATPRALVCPYHAWAYRYDGSLIAAPGFANAAGFDALGHVVEAVAGEGVAWLGVRRRRCRCA